MDFRKELAKELGLGAISENTMLDDYVKACEVIAIRYHDSKVKNLNIPAVINQRELLVAFNKEMAKLHSWFLPAEDSMIDEFLNNK